MEKTSEADPLSDLPPEIEAFIDRLYNADSRPPNYLSGAVRKHEIKLLVRLFLRHRPSHSVEWGLGSGISASAFSYARSFLGLSNQHVVLDPFQVECAGGWGLKCLEEFQRRQFVDFLPISSEEFLVQSRKQGRKFDFAFIDGAHDVGHKLADACLVADVISEGGMVSFHDSFFRSSSLAIKYLVEDRGFELMDVNCESVLKRRLRGVKHVWKVGISYAIKCAPKVNFAVSVLIKRQTL
jgi:hypothetical protein